VVGLCSRPDNDWIYIVRRYINCPVPDSKLLGKVLARLEAPLVEAERTIRDGQAVLVYCNAGRNRSSLFSALLLGMVGGYSGKDAAEMVMSARPRAFGSNPAMLEYLLALP
jgi:protein-tyrosine phosphatase